MFETLSILPFSFWVVVVLIAGGVIWASGHVVEGFGIPVMAVLGTVLVWYVGDVLYNDYQMNYMTRFTPEIMSEAWMEVALFIIVFLVLVPVVHRKINRRDLKRSGHVIALLKAGTGAPGFQHGLQQLFFVCIGLWGVLCVVAAFRLEGEVVYYFFPYLSYRADPWSRGRIGGGIDSLLSLATYLQIFLAGVFGTMTALLHNPRLRALAVVGCLLSWPYFIFDRTRNPMLAVVVPAILAWVFLRLRGGWLSKMAVLALCFIVINGWLGFVMANRGTVSIAEEFSSEGFNLGKSQSVHHEGLNMYEELCWINTFITIGLYEPNWGQRYLAELVNPIPRVLWPGKPLIGIDYALLRGQAFDEGAAGVAATISTGMIGQGVVNFGRVLGPAFAALLMSIWVAILAHLDLRGQQVGRLPLYGLGLILTFNLGRDITLITLYTFVFGALVVWWMDRRAVKRVVRCQPSRSGKSTGTLPASAKTSGRKI